MAEQRGHSPLPRLPNFLVIGAMKSGTTSLYHYLRHHPQVFMPDTKEVNFFNPMRNWRRGVEWYEQQFEGAEGDAVAVGEASTSYTKFPWVRGVPARIASTLDDVRLVYVVRDPIERMRSHYLHNLAIGQEWRSIEDAFHKEPMYANISRYALQIDQYVPYVPRDKLLVVQSEDLQNERVATLGRVFRFLGVDEGWTPPAIDREFYRSSDRRMNPSLRRRIRRIPQVRRMAMYAPGAVKRLKHTLTEGLPTAELDVDRASVSEDLRQALQDILREDVARLRQYLGDDFHGWGVG